MSQIIKLTAYPGATIAWDHEESRAMKQGWNTAKVVYRGKSFKVMKITTSDPFYRCVEYQCNGSIFSSFDSLMHWIID